MNLPPFGKHKVQQQTSNAPLVLSAAKILEVTTPPQVFNLERDNHVGAT